MPRRTFPFVLVVGLAGCDGSADDVEPESVERAADVAEAPADAGADEPEGSTSADAAWCESCVLSERLTAFASGGATDCGAVTWDTASAAVPCIEGALAENEPLFVEVENRALDSFSSTGWSYRDGELLEALLGGQ